MRCPTCGEDNPDRAKFRLNCAAPLTVAASPREVRKSVTIIFSDVAGSTAMGEGLDPETLRKVMGRYFDAMKAEIEGHVGTVEKFIVDAVMAVFGIPRTHDDDALRAVRVALDMRRVLGELNEGSAGNRRSRSSASLGVRSPPWPMTRNWRIAYASWSAANRI